MSDRRRVQMPEKQAHRIQAANQARGERARRHLERARARRRQGIAKESRSRRRATVDPTPRRRLLAVGFFSVSAAAGLIWAWPILDVAAHLGAGPATHIERIAIQGLATLSSTEVAAATRVAPGEDSLDVDPAAVAQRLRDHPWIRDAHVMRLPTGKLLVQIEEREPVAVLAPVGESEITTWRYVDDTGTPFAALREGDLERAGAWPRLRGGEALADGLAHPELAAALVLQRHLRASALPGLLGAGDDLELRLPRPGDAQGWTLVVGRDRRLVVLGREHLVLRLDRLEVLLRSNVDALDGTTTIDLRFADRAILRSSSASG